MFETGDAVKSSPAVDPATGLVIVGSHDGHLYALDPQVGTTTVIQFCMTVVVIFKFLYCVLMS